MHAQNHLSQSLKDGKHPDKNSLDDIFPSVYEELHRLAESFMKRERSDHTLRPTALVHEAYLRLTNQKNVDWENRVHFFSIAAQMMRRILSNYARDRNANKRGGGIYKVSLDKAVNFFEQKDVELAALDDALTQLSTFDERQSRIVELRFFGGLTTEEVAEVIGVSNSTVKREWRMAKAWLRKEIMNGH
jgi:RNA polymerase sigma factor (TIGR02999 family)